MIENIDQNLLRLENLRILDVGAASGDNAIAMAKLGAKITAVEISESLVTEFKKKANSKNIEIILGDATKVKLPPGAFDGAIVLEVLEHVHSSEKILASINGALKDNGTLCVSVPTSYTEKFYWSVFKSYPKNSTHVKIYKKQQIIDEIEGAGFKVISVQNRNLEPAVSWFFHSILHSKSDHTGKILNHSWVDGYLSSLFDFLRRHRVTRRLLVTAERRLGKSWYIYAKKA